MTPQDQINPDGSAANPWKLCTMQHVEEVKCLLRVIPVWAAAVTYYVAIVQQHTFVVFHAVQSNRHLGKSNFQILATSYIVFLMSLSIWTPIYDRIVVPFLRRIPGKEGGITILPRMGIDIFLSVITLIVSALVDEHWRTEGPTALIKPILGILSVLVLNWVLFFIYLYYYLMSFLSLEFSFFLVQKCFYTPMFK